MEFFDEFIDFFAKMNAWEWAGFFVTIFLTYAVVKIIIWIVQLLTTL